MARPHKILKLKNDNHLYKKLVYISVRRADIGFKYLYPCLHF